MEPETWNFGCPDSHTRLSETESRRERPAIPRGKQRVLATYLFDTKPTDPLTFAGVVVAFMVAGVVACIGPAWRATMQRTMARDHSWQRAAEQYEALYKG